MKKLFLLRHTQALPASGTSDFDRPLSPQGEKDARAQGEVIKKKNYQPNMVICSPALRTKTTLDLLLEPLKKPVIEYAQILYDGDLEDYRTILESAGSYKNIMIVGHNPVIHALAANMAKEDGSTRLGKLVSGYIPGTLSVFECDIENWSDIELHQNRLVDYLPPPLPY